MTKRTMPAERESVTKKIKIGALEGYVNCGLYEDGTPGELFLTIHKGGSFERGLCHALALIISLALQRGVPLKEIADKLTYLRFEPSGVTGDPTIPHVESLMDYLGKWLTARFLTKPPSETV